MYEVLVIKLFAGRKHQKKKINLVNLISHCSIENLFLFLGHSRHSILSSFTESQFCTLLMSGNCFCVCVKETE